MNNKTKQKELFYLGYYNYKIDGIFGTRSRKATREFQKEYNLKIDGIFGKNTIKKMYEVWKRIQLDLNYHNNSVLKIDGLVGPKTISEINKFQKNKKLKVDSIVNKDTLRLLGEYDIKPKYPVEVLRITQAFKPKTHNGIDIGWDRKLSKDAPLIYAPLNMKIVHNSSSSTAGNYIVSIANYNSSNDILFRFLHLDEKPSLKVGDIVNFNTPFAVMGTTGRSTGVHLHFEVWIVPKNYKYSFSDIYKYMKNPIDYIYFYPDQVLNGKSSTYNILTF